METIIEQDKKKISADIVKASAIRHQQSKSECGIYALFYIWARLHNISYDYFLKNSVPDQLMFEFRQHLFNDPSRRVLKSFNWLEYKKTVHIKWE